MKAHCHVWPTEWAVSNLFWISMSWYVPSWVYVRVIERLIMYDCAAATSCDRRIHQERSDFCVVVNQAGRFVSSNLQFYYFRFKPHDRKADLKMNNLWFIMLYMYVIVRASPSLNTLQQYTSNLTFTININKS